MARPTLENVRTFLAGGEPPLISIYLPTHRAIPDSLQDPIRYKNLVAAAENSLREKYPSREVQSLLKPFRALIDDSSFWKHQRDGLAIFGSSTRFDALKLQRPVEELAVVADSFHLKPLIRISQSADRYQVLCLDRHRARMFEGNRDSLDELDTNGLAMTMERVVGEEKTEPHLSAVSASAGGPRSSGQTAVFHGHGGREDEVKKDTERFFRSIDRDVTSHFSRPSGLPLILVALTEHHAEFRKLSHNPALQAEAVAISPTALTVEQLRDEVWKAVEPNYNARLAKLADAYHNAAAHDHGRDKLHDVGKAIVDGRVKTLLVEADRLSPGRFDSSTGEIHPRPLDDPKTDDLLDDFSECVLRAGGEVVVVPADRMPTKTGLAAILRF